MNVINILESIFFIYLFHYVKYISLFIYLPSHLSLYLPIYMMCLCIDIYLFTKTGLFIYSALKSIFDLVAYHEQLSIDSILKMRTTF